MSRKKATTATTTQNSTSNSARRPQRPGRERLATSILEELWSIWRADPRVPSVKSRRLWAIARDANPRLVDNWFLRRRTCAKKAGQQIPDGSYELPPITIKREQSETLFDTTVDLHSDDTLVYFPDVDDLNDLYASSDTAFDEDTVTESKISETSAYMEDHHCKSKPSSEDEDNSFESASFPVCDQNRGMQSNFTCVLCSQGPFERTCIYAPLRYTGTPDVIQSDPGTIPDPCLRLDFSPTTLSELSAIPFLFRTPLAVLPPDSAADHQHASIEDELGHLVNEGKLDFSFLEAPHLATMQLND